MEAMVTTQQTKWTILPCTIKMLYKEREREPENSNPTSIYNKNATVINHRKLPHTQTKSLPPAGYLFREKLDTTNIIDPQDMGLKILQARRKGKIALYNTPEQHMNQVKKLRSKMGEKRVGRTTKDQQMWGDDINYSSSWPKINPNGHIRLMFYNVHGISYKHDFVEMDMIMQIGSQVQADVMMLTEINLNLYKPRVRTKLRESIRAYDKYAKIQLAYPPDSPVTTSDFNMGGNMVIVQGGLSGRCGEQGADIYGRWGWITIKGETNSMIIISGYKVGKNNGSPGGTSVAQQEVRAMLRRDHKLAN